MCQNQDGTETLPTPVISFGKTCMRCEDAAVVALKANDLAFCRSCFLSYFTHKFRSTIGKSKLVKKGEK
ncbi:cytoplasmic tRNA 2-thiolation protein 2-like, partial [Saccoglossus kowalevskii]